MLSKHSSKYSAENPVYYLLFFYFDEYSDLKWIIYQNNL